MGLNYVRYNFHTGARRVKTNAAVVLTGALLAISGLGLTFGLIPGLARADSQNITFEPNTYHGGDINGQDGWTKTGPFDAAVSDNTSGSNAFGTQSLRISDAVTSGSFGDQVFAKPLINAVGETSATANGFTVGSLQNYFDMQFDIASATPSTQQTGMHVSVSPDRGDGSRMSYLRFEDNSDGIDVFFDDVSGTSSPVSFDEVKVATLNRSVPHTVRLAMHAVDGPSNDVVKVWVDGALVKTGTSWENYYRYDAESTPEQTPRVVKTILFRESGTANSADQNKGFLFDNLNYQSLSNPTITTPTITTPANNSTLTSTQLTKIDWTDATGSFVPPVTYQYQAYSDAGYTSQVYSSPSTLTDSAIPTPGTPEGTYYVQVRAIDAFGNTSGWSNGASNPYKITVKNVLTPTSTDQCKKDGWKTFNAPAFTNQGQCVRWVGAEAHGDMRLSGPRQQVRFNLANHVSSNDQRGRDGDENRRKNSVEYWNYDYPGGLHYTAKALCTSINPATGEARFMFQIPAGHPGLSGLYVVAYVKEGKGKHATDLYGHAATSDLATATQWCNTGAGYAPTMYTVTKSELEIE